jgi:hypothetical protein
VGPFARVRCFVEYSPSPSARGPELAADGAHVRRLSEALGAPELVVELARLPDLPERAYMAAARCTDNSRFPQWRHEPGALPHAPLGAERRRTLSEQTTLGGPR